MRIVGVARGLFRRFGERLLCDPCLRDWIGFLFGVGSAVKAGCCYELWMDVRLFIMFLALFCIRCLDYVYTVVFKLYATIQYVLDRLSFEPCTV